MKGKLSINYNKEGDYLEIFIKTQRPTYGEEVTSGITIFRDEETDEVIGIGILNFEKKASSPELMNLDLPFEVNFSAISK